MKERFVNPLIDVVFKTLWLRADDDLRSYLNRIVEYAIDKDISGYRIGTKEESIYKDYGMLMCEIYEEMEELAGNDAGRKALIKMLKTLGRSEEFMTVMDKYEYEKNLTH